MTKVVEHTKQEALTRPPRKWFNWFAVFKSARDASNRPVCPGDEGVDPRSWPSREVAEQKASEVLRFDGDCLLYIGAYPEGERP